MRALSAFIGGALGLSLASRSTASAYEKFESIVLQQRVNKLSVPEEAIAREEAAIALTSRS